jgi:hypothetical protein
MAIIDKNFALLYKISMTEMRQDDGFTELIRDSLLADIKMGAYNGRIHGGHFAELARRDSTAAIELLFEFLESQGLTFEDLPRSVDAIASHLHWDTQQEHEAFVAEHTPAGEGGNLIRHQGQPTTSAEDLAEFFADVDAFRARH